MVSRKKGSKKNKKRIDAQKLTVAVVAAVVIVVAAVLLIFSGGGSNLGDDEEILADTTTKITENVFINSVDVGGMTIPEAQKALQDSENEKISAYQLTFKADQETHILTSKDFMVKSDLEDVLCEAMRLGRDEQGQDIPAEIEKIALNAVRLETQLMPDENTLQQALVQLGTDKLDIEAADATFELRPDPNIRFGYTPETNGRRLDAPAAAQKALANAEKGDHTPVELQFEEIIPQYTMAYFEEHHRMIGSHTTTLNYGQNDAERVFNITKAAQGIDGSEIKPEALFSTLKAVGMAKGEYKPSEWKQAPGYESGKVTLQYGGGICQVSSTLFVAALRADLSFTERRPHTMKVSYMDYGLDAAIDAGGIDLVLKNKKETSVFIFARVDEANRTLTVAIYGTPLEGGNTITIQSKHVSDIPQPEPKTTTDEKMDYNTRFVEEKGRQGSVWDAYKIVKDANGNELENRKIFSSTYMAFPDKYVEGPADPDNPNGEKRLVTEANRYEKIEPEESQEPTDPTPSPDATPEPEQPTPDPGKPEEPEPPEKPDEENDGE
ncbi:MAG: VanW family protein [Christensenellales bacterium]|jgi:vancomycin resistance protein YoaR